MTRAIVHPLWGSLSLDREARRSLQAQVVAYFRAAIVEGKVRRGLRLPSSRQLAQEHGISRTTAVEAYERLIAEGYLIARPASGIFVADRIPEDFSPTGACRSDKAPPAARRPMHLLDQRSYQLPLAPGMPAADLFPWSEWNRHLAAVMRERPIAEIAHGDPMGEQPLREAIADYLAAQKGISCDPDQIVVVGGTIQIFDLALELLRAPGKRAIVEDPVYPFIPNRLSILGFETVGASIDEQGMDVAMALARTPDAHLAFVSPSHNVPSGAVLSLERRQALVDWADRTDGWIVENEFDGDFRFGSRPLPTCFSLSRRQRVVLIGSMSKPFAPGLRLGYLLLPPDLVPRAQALPVPQAAPSSQLALARLAASGSLATHLRQLRIVHERRRAQLLEALAVRLGGLADLIHAPEAGLRLVLALPDGVDDLALARACLEVGVRVEALSPCHVERRPRSGLVLGFGGTAEADIAPAVARLSEQLRLHLGRA